MCMCMCVCSCWNSCTFDQVFCCSAQWPRGFLDTINISELLQQAVCTEHPLDQLVYAFQQHLAPYVIQATSEFTQSVASMLAGCKHSVSLTKLYLRTSFYDVVGSCEDCNILLFVDDVCMKSTRHARSEAQNSIVPAAPRFNAKLKSHRLKLSPKAMVSTSDNKRTRSRIWEMKANGMQLASSSGSFLQVQLIAQLHGNTKAQLQLPSKCSSLKEHPRPAQASNLQEDVEQWPLSSVWGARHS